MSDLSVLQVQEALRHAASLGHDLTTAPHMVKIAGRPYPASFKSLDIRPTDDGVFHGFVTSNIPHENASVHHIHTNTS